MDINLLYNFVQISYYLLRTGKIFSRAFDAIDLKFNAILRYNSAS